MELEHPLSTLLYAFYKLKIRLFVSLQKSFIAQSQSFQQTSVDAETLEASIHLSKQPA